MTNMTTYAQAWLQDSTDGTIKLAVSAGDEVIIQVAALPDASWNIPALSTALTGEFIFPVGTQMNPEVITSIEEIKIALAEGNNQGYYLTWTADAAGTLTLTCPAIEGIEYDVNMINMSTYAQAWLVDSTDGTISLEVAEGDVINIQVAVIPDSNWFIAAADITLTGAVKGAEEPAAPIVITSQPTDLAVEKIEYGVFTVVAEGNGLTYKWYYSKDAGANWQTTTLEGYNTNALTVQAIDSRNGYMYRCVIKDAEGNELTSEAATLTVTPSTKVGVITANPQDVDTVAGYNALFTVEGENIESYKWQWRRNEEAPWVYTTLPGNATNELTVWSIVSRSGRQYRCRMVALNGAVLYSEAATLTVTPSIYINTNPSRQTTDINQIGTFVVEAEGVAMGNDSTELTYQWIYRTGPDDDTWKNTTLEGYNTPELKVEGQTRRNGYQYRCAITDARGIKVYSNVATLSVIGFSKQPVDKTVAAGSDAVFSVVAQGSDLTYQWQYKKPNGSWSNTGKDGNKTATLTVDAVAASNNGYQYRCRIQDSNGVVAISEAATLTVTTPVTITSQPISVTAAVGQTVQFSVVATGDAASYKWEFSKDGGNTWQSTSLSGYNTDTLTVEVLANRNGYVYRCTITDVPGNKTVSEPATLTIG